MARHFAIFSSSIRGDIKIPSLQPQTFHKNSHNHQKGSATQLTTFADISQNWLGLLPLDYIVIRYPKQMVPIAVYDLSHTFDKQVTNVSQPVFLILLLGMLMSPLMNMAVVVDMGLNFQLSLTLNKYLHFESKSADNLIETMWLSPEICQVRVSTKSLFIQWGCVGGGGGGRCPSRVRTGHISMDGGHQGRLSCLGIVSTMCSTTRVRHTDRSQRLNHSLRSTQLLPTHLSASGYTGSQLWLYQRPAGYCLRSDTL